MGDPVNRYWIKTLEKTNLNSQESTIRSFGGQMETIKKKSNGNTKIEKYIFN